VLMRNIDFLKVAVNVHSKGC